MAELSKRLIYEPCSLTRGHHLKGGLTAIHLYQFLQYRDQYSQTAPCACSHVHAYLARWLGLYREGHAIK